MKVPSSVTVREFESGRRYEVRLEATGEDGVRHQRRRRFRTLRTRSTRTPPSPRSAPPERSPRRRS